MAKKPAGLIYGVDDTPPLVVSILLGLQHVFVMTAGWIMVVVIVTTIGGTETVPAGVFRVDDQGQARFPLQVLAQGESFDKFAVTLEPAAGVEKPTGPMVLLGNL